jgi:hypothetical protein
MIWQGPRRPKAGAAHHSLRRRAIALRDSERSQQGLEIPVIPAGALDLASQGTFRLPKPVCLHADHLNYLTATGHEFSQSLAVGIGDRTWFGTNTFSEQRNDLSIESVGFGESSGGAGEIPDQAD